MNSEQQYANIILEEVRSDIKAILELVIPMRQELTDIKKSVADIPDMKQDIATIKAGLTATNHQVTDHEHRITWLEAAKA